MFIKKTPHQKEWDKYIKKEAKYLEKQMTQKESILNQKLEEKVPEKLQGTLDVAFAKAFHLVFEKGIGVIEKTYHKEDIKKNYLINEFTNELKQDRKSIRAFSKNAKGSGTKNLIMSGAAGIGMGILGVGFPDIPVFTGMILKSIYEIAMHYGYSYETEEEQYFILLLIQGAVTHGEEMLSIDKEINQYITSSIWVQEKTKEEMIQKTASYLSKELLYMKFLQGIPVVGAVGGAYDVIYLKQITEYANLKYERRFLEMLGRKGKQKA
ncbi:MAG: EcsC family protein [Lachnospiraceae bacterium]|nr:EcsC family protein [Lachnospiraceae bacterium]